MQLALDRPGMALLGFDYVDEGPDRTELRDHRFIGRLSLAFIIKGIEQH